MTLPPLALLTPAVKYEPIRELHAHNRSLEARVAELEAKLKAPAKTPDNSSLPPSTGRKANRPSRETRAKTSRKGRKGTARRLAETPDDVAECRAASCRHCSHALAPDG